MGRRKVTVILYPGEEGRYTAFVPLLRGCTTQGDSPNNAFEMAKECIELMLQDATDDDIESLDMSWVPHVVVGEVEVQVPSRHSRVAKKRLTEVRA